MQQLAKPLPEYQGWPLLGVLPRLIQQGIQTFLEEARRRYGDLYRLRLGPIPMVIANHPSHAQHIFRDRVSNYHKGGGFWDAVRELTGNGLVASEGDFWLRQRRMMQPQFHRQRISALAELMIEAIEESLLTWREGPPTDLTEAFPAVTMRVISKTMFGHGLKPQEIAQASEALHILIGYVTRGLLVNALPSWIPKPGQRRFLQAKEETDVVIRRLIQTGREAKGAEQNNLLAMMLSLTADDGTGMTDTQLRDEAISVFLAGYETTSVALMWAMLLLLQNPSVLQKLQQEVDSLNGETPSLETIPRLSYTRQVLQESMRLRSPVSWLPRVARNDDVIDGYQIPAGSTVVLPIYMFHHHPEFWEEPGRFMPERFSSEKSERRHTFAWMPFGAGPRVCIGKDFAMLEGQLILATILQRFQFTLLPKDGMGEQSLSSLRPKGGVWVQLKKRKLESKRS